VLADSVVLYLVMGEAKLDCSANSCGHYKELFVYLVDGPVASHLEAGLGASFIGNWVEGKQSFLFFSAPAQEEMKRLVDGMSDLTVMDEFRFTYDQWQGGGLTPTIVGPYLIHPPWLPADPRPDEIPIVLDPGVVFGNGLHPTTRDCLFALFEVFEKGSEINRVVDLGTGTGILALAAAKLGARSVLAVDLNPLCAKTALRNVRLNGLEGIVSVWEGDAESQMGEVADLAVANLHFDLIGTLLRRGAFLKTVRVIISGLMRTQWREIRHRLVMNGYLIEREWDHEMTWFTILARNQGGSF